MEGVKPWIPGSMVSLMWGATICNLELVLENVDGKLFEADGGSFAAQRQEEMVGSLSSSSN